MYVLADLLRLALPKIAMKIPKGPDTNQLTFDFRNASLELQMAVNKFAAATELLVAASAAAEVAAAQPKEVTVPLQDDNLRQLVAQAVLNLSMQSGMSVHRTWVLAYDYLCQYTGFNAAYWMAEGKFKRKLDAVQAHNMLSALHHIVVRMMCTDTFRGKVKLAELSPA